MLQRLYVHNFRCLENFELNLKELPSSLLIGKNGSGKSTVRDVLEIFQKIGRGTNRISDLVKIKDFAKGRSDIPIRFEIDVLLEGKLYQYVLALELPDNFKELRVREEQLKINDALLYSRDIADVSLHRTRSTIGGTTQSSVQGVVQSTSQFSVDWHIAALPVIQSSSDKDLLYRFKTWLEQIIILSPVPQLMRGESQGETLSPDKYGREFGDWLSGVLGQFPSSYTYIDNYLKTIMPDLEDIQNSPTGRETKELIVKFQKNGTNSFSVPFDDLSDGEKCFFLSAVVLAANKSYGPLFCFWDEPDNYLGLSEVGHFIVSLRRAFENGSGGQFVATSHNPEAIRRFSDENTHLLYRDSHLEPVRIKLLSEMKLEGDLINTLILGDLEP